MNIIENKISPVSFAEQLGSDLNLQATAEEKKIKGQFFTSTTIALYMANLMRFTDKKSLRVLDPGAGVGMLTAALVERILRENKQVDLFVDLFDNDRLAIPSLAQNMEHCKTLMEESGNRFEYRILEDDFILYHAGLFTKDIFTEEVHYPKYDMIISNPPYFKVNKNHEYSRILKDYIHGQPNVYFMFMAVAERLLLKQGQLVFITPRSYCSGSYFEKFREKFFDSIDPSHIHVFSSRKGNFKNENVLQENIILSGFKRPYQESKITISSSSISFMNNDYKEEIFTKSLVIDSSDQINLIRLPLNQEEAEILELFDRWSNNLTLMDMNISTGPVVTFRNTESIAPYSEETTYPLIYMKHLGELRVNFPLNNKDTGIIKTTQAKSLLLPAKNYVLLKRFTSKEQKKRVDCAVYEDMEYPYQFIGIENHLNYIYGNNKSLTREEVYGIAAFLNSSIVDNYFRIINGNTQVNASDIKPLPFPPFEQIKDLGKRIIEQTISYEGVDEWILNLPSHPEYKIGGKDKLTKEQEALEILTQLELPLKQQNSRSVLTLLALLNLKPNDEWTDAQTKLLRIVDIMEFIRVEYGTEYAANSRESIRRQTIHQFERAQIIARNVDDPSRATNSGKTNYSVTPEFLTLVRSYGTAQWEEELKVFKNAFESLTKKYESQRDLIKVPVRLKDGSTLDFSPGAHNELQKAIIEEFAAYFAPGAELLYVGDTADKDLYVDRGQLELLGIDNLAHDKLPDVVLYDKEKDWVFFVEAVTSHGPISPKRKLELTELLATSNAGPVFITAFPNLITYKKYAAEIAWDTEVWFSDDPQHMIHRNGDRFLGPRK